LIVAFQYSSEEEEYIEYANEGKSKFAEDYFEWFVLYKYVDNNLEELISIECA